MKQFHELLASSLVVALSEIEAKGPAPGTKEGAWFEALPDELKKQYVEEHPNSKYAKGWKAKHGPSDTKDVLDEHEARDKEIFETEKKLKDLKENIPEEDDPEADEQRDRDIFALEKKLKDLKALRSAPKEKPEAPPPPSKEGKEGKKKKKLTKEQKKELKRLRKLEKQLDKEEEEEDLQDQLGTEDREGKPNPKPKKHNPNVKKLPKKSQKFINSSETEAGSSERKSIGSSVIKASKHVANAALKETKGLASAVGSAISILEGQGSRRDIGSVAKVGFMLLASSALASTLAVSGPAAILTFMALKHLAVPAMGNLVKAAFTRGPVSEKPKYEFSEEYKASGAKGISPYGYWKDRDTWVSETKEEWERNYDKREGEARSFASVMASSILLTAASIKPEEAVQSLVQQLGIFAAEGQIDDADWDKAVDEQAADDTTAKVIARLLASLYIDAYIALHPNDEPGMEGYQVWGKEFIEAISGGDVFWGYPNQYDDNPTSPHGKEPTEGDLDSEVDPMMDQQWFGRTDVDRGNYPVTNTQLTGHPADRLIDQLDEEYIDDDTKTEITSDMAPQGTYDNDRDSIIDERYGEGYQQLSPETNEKPDPFQFSEGDEEFPYDLDKEGSGIAPNFFRVNNMQPLG